MRRRTVVLALGIGLAAANELPAQAPATVLLRGHVVGEDARPQTNVELRVVSYGTVRVDDSAEFRTPIPAGVVQVQLILVEPAGLTILFPPGGEQAIPAGGVSVPVVIGRSDRQYLVEALSGRLLELRKAVREGDQGTADVMEELVAGVHSILEKLGASEAELRASLDQRQARGEVAADLEAVLDTYLLKLEDLRDVFALLGPGAASDEASLLGLLQAMATYNEAYTALDAKKDSAESRIASLWAEGAAEGLRRDWGDVRVEAVTRIHQGIVLPLNPSLVVLQREHTPSPPSPQDVRQAVEQVAAAAKRLDEEIPVLEERKARLFASLDRP